MSRISVGCLSWLTEKNIDERFANWQASIKSLNLLKQQDCDIFVLNNNGLTKTSNFVHELCGDVKIYSLNKNYYDVAIHVCTFLHALKHNNEYMLYTYDDMVFSDPCFIDDCLTFLDYSRNTACMRLSKFVCHDKYYDATRTPKIKNPEAVRLNNTTKNENYYVEGPINVRRHEFYRTNLRPISRPTIWRTERFAEFLKNVDNVPVMQIFEQHMYDVCDRQQEWVSSFVQHGVCHTFPQDTSQRLKISLSKWDEITVRLQDIKDDFYDA